MMPLIRTWSSSALSLISIKYAFILFLKITLIFANDHRKKFYLHTLLL